MSKKQWGMLLTLASAGALVAEAYFAFFNRFAIHDQIHNLLALAGCLGVSAGLLLWLRDGLR